MSTIVIVEDDRYLREELENILQKEGYTVKCISSFHGVAGQVIGYKPSLVLLDLTLPGLTGFEILKQLKGQGVGPILILTAREQLQDELHALNLGADDYLIKPCPASRLIAKVNKLLHLYQHLPQLLQTKKFQLDANTYALYHGEKILRLPETEGKILKTLIEAGGETVTKEKLFKVLWGGSNFVDENILQVNITRLRKSLEGVGLYGCIKTLRAVGYKLEEGAENEKSKKV